MKNMSTMKKLSSSLLLIFTLVFVLFSATNVQANRAAAGEIAYKWVSDSTYLLTYTFYKDCAGATAEPSTINVCYFNTCNIDRGNVTLNKKTPLGSNGLPVQDVCTGTSSTTCSSPAGTLRGYRKWVYEGTVTLPSKCGSWRFVVSIGLRNGAITNYTVPGAANNLYTEATLNNIDAPTSSSPTFALDPIQYMCSGVKQHFSYSGVDADGDVLTYSLIDPASAADNQTTCTFPPTPASYVFAGGALGGTSLATNPFATGGSFNLNSTNGLMSFTPTVAQVPQLALLVTKRRGSKVVGSVIRDMQFVVSTGCTPSGTAFAINFPGSTGVLNAAALTPGPAGIPTTGAIVCPHSPHTIRFSITANPGVTINNVTDNSSTFAPTASTSTMSPYSGLGTRTVTANFTWTPNQTDEGQQYIVVRSEVCSPGSPIVYRLDSIPIYVSLTVKIFPKDTMMCFGETTTLCVRPANFPGITVDWSITVPGSGLPTGGTLGISSPTDSCTDVSPSSTTTYLVTSNHPSYCNRIEPGKTALTSNQDEIKIVVVNPKIDVGPDTVMCSYSQLQLNSNLLNPQPELTYKYQWGPNPGSVNPGPIAFLSDPNIPNPILRFPAGTPLSSIPDTIEYIMKLTPFPDTTCLRFDTIKIFVLKGFYLLTGDTLGSNTGLGHLGRQKGVSDTAICNGQTITLLGLGDQRYNYIWTPATGVSTPNGFLSGMTITPTGTTTYALTASRSGCRDSTKLLTILVEPTPVADIGADQSICFGDTLNLFANITPDPTVFTQYKYKWSPGGALSRADTFFCYFTGYLTQQIKFTVTTPAGCTGVDSALYTVQPRAFLTKGNDTAICPGDVAKLSVAGDDKLVGVTWKPASTIDSIHSLTPIVTPNHSTSYVVVGTDSNSCVDSAVVNVTVYPRALIYLPDSATIYPGDFYALDPQGNSLYYTWFPPIGLDFPSIANPKASPKLNTTYYVTGVTDAGCVAEDSIHIFVSPDSQIDVPNAFVPGRGDNNKFKPVHLGTATLKSFTVYNRWGVKMFETTNIEEGWDGNFSGQPQPLGVYVYVLEAISANGRVISKQGNVTLVR